MVGHQWPRGKESKGDRRGHAGSGSGHLVAGVVSCTGALSSISGQSEICWQAAPPASEVVSGAAADATATASSSDRTVADHILQFF